MPVVAAKSWLSRLFGETMTSDWPLLYDASLTMKPAFDPPYHVQYGRLLLR